MKEIFVCKADSLSLLDDDIKRKRPTLRMYVRMYNLARQTHGTGNQFLRHDVTLVEVEELRNAMIVDKVEG